MYIKMLLPFCAFLLCAACAPQASMQAQPMQTNQLLRDLKAEGCCEKNFVPSAALIENYSLREENKIYYVGGFLHVNETTLPSDIQKFNAKVNTQLDSLWTVHVPIQNLEPLLKTQGVKTFEVGRKAQLKRVGSKQLQ